MQTWSVPLQVMSILKRVMPDVDPCDYMQHLLSIAPNTRDALYDLLGTHDSIHNLISQVFIKHRPGTNEYLLKYMPTVQYGRMWNDFYRQCRGTVIDMDKMIAFHSYDKFMNIGEVEENYEEVLLHKAESTHYQVMNKWDGSLIMFYFNDGAWRTSTNGSFESEQAQWALEYARDSGLLDSLAPSFTHMYEAIYPSNRIVVNYGDIEALIPLAYRDMTTGKLWPRGGHGMDESMTLRDCLDARDNHGATEKEGWVIAFSDGHLVKIKCTDYVNVHRLKEYITPEGVFDMIRNDTLDDVRSALPDDIRAEVDDIVRRYVEWETDLRNDCTLLVHKVDATDKRGTYEMVSNFYPNGTFEKWYALKYVRGEIDEQQSPLMRVTNFGKIKHIFKAGDVNG